MQAPCDPNGTLVLKSPTSAPLVKVTSLHGTGHFTWQPRHRMDARGHPYVPWDSNIYRCWKKSGEKTSWNGKHHIFCRDFIHVRWCRIRHSGLKLNYKYVVEDSALSNLINNIIYCTAIIETSSFTFFIMSYSSSGVCRFGISQMLHACNIYLHEA